MMRHSIFMLLFLFLSLGCQAEELFEEVRFPTGEYGVELERGLARGDTITFHLDAAAGQTMWVDVSSLEDNVVFKIICSQGLLGESEWVEGSQYWEGTLPETGTYFIEVGTTRGGAEFTIEIEIE